MSQKEIHDDFIKTLEDVSPYSMEKKWDAEFRRGWESLEDYKQSRCSNEATTDENELVHSLIMCDRRRNLRDIARQMGISFGVVQSILTDRDVQGLS